MPASDRISCSSVPCFRVYGFRLNPKSTRKLGLYGGELFIVVRAPRWAQFVSEHIDSFLSLAATLIITLVAWKNSKRLLPIHQALLPERQKAFQQKRRHPLLRLLLLLLLLHRQQRQVTHCISVVVTTYVDNLWCLKVFCTTLATKSGDAIIEYRKRPVREPFAQIGFFFETYLPLYDWYILEILYLPNTRLGYPSNCQAFLSAKFVY